MRMEQRRHLLLFLFVRKQINDFRRADTPLPALAKHRFGHLHK
jgi:hypothetical protein